jgi:predicted transposase YbfD/YdcC
MDIIGNISGYFEEIETKQEYDGYWYSVKETIVISILGSLCGLRNMIMIVEWAKSPTVTKFLQEKVKIAKVPGYAQYANIMGIIKSESLNEAFIKWIGSIVEVSGKTLAIDGKTIRATENMSTYEKPIHIVSAYISELRITLGQSMAESKGNEPEAFRDLLEMLDISGALVVADALNCKVKTCEKIIAGGADYLLCIKRNNAKLCEEIKSFIHDGSNADKLEKSKTIEKHGNRIERRTAYVNYDIERLKNAKKWVKLSCIGAIHRQVEINGKMTDEWSYYISSRKLNPQDFLKHVRSEWSVESMHWLLDVHFDEDHTRVFNGNTQKNLNIIRKIALNLISDFKRETESKKPVSGFMRSCLFDVDFLYVFLNSLAYHIILNNLLSN